VSYGEGLGGTFHAEDAIRRLRHLRRLALVLARSERELVGEAEPEGCGRAAGTYGERMANERERARAVLRDALAGDLELGEFHRQWPKSDDPLLNVLFEEAEDTVEHEPGSWFWFRRGGDQARFRETVPFKTLVVDATLLADDFADVPSERLVAIRVRLLQEIDLEQENDELAADVRAFVTRQI
jgi:hypothetical protein